MTCGINLNLNAVTEQDPLFLNCLLESGHREDHKWEDHEVTVKKMTLFDTIQKIINPKFQELNYWALDFDHYEEKEKIAFAMMILYNPLLNMTVAQRREFLNGLVKSTSWFTSLIDDLESFTSIRGEILRKRSFK